jgi:hypothetical protein
VRTAALVSYIIELIKEKSEGRRPVRDLGKLSRFVDQDIVIAVELSE